MEREFSTKAQLREALVKDNVTIPAWAVGVYGVDENIYATIALEWNESRNEKIHQVSGMRWDPLNSAIAVKDGEFFDVKTHSSPLAVFVLGDNRIGKTTVQRIITKALEDAGIEVTLGQTATDELTNACEDAGVAVEAIKHIKEHTNVIVEEIHTPILRVFAASVPRTIVSYRGYTHSGGFKIVPVYKS